MCLIILHTFILLRTVLAKPATVLGGKKLNIPPVLLGQTRTAQDRCSICKSWSCGNTVKTGHKICNYTNRYLFKNTFIEIAFTNPTQRDNFIRMNASIMVYLYLLSEQNFSRLLQIFQDQIKFL